jgi:hypothetical protein
MATNVTGAKKEWVERVLGVPLEAKAPGAAMTNWKKQREAAVGSLRETATKIAAAKHPSSAKAIIEIQAVIKNLTGEPSSLQQVKELQRYIDSDQVVYDVSELAENIRTPLLDALSLLSKELAA